MTLRHLFANTRIYIDQPPKFKNIGYLSMGYDLISGNPHETKALDPGFKGIRVFQLTYDQNQTTPDGNHSVPDHVTATDQPICSFDFSTSAITGTASYSQSLSVDAAVQGGGWGAHFSASVDYQHVSEITSGQEDRLYSSKAQCTVYEATIAYNTAELTKDFVDSVKRLTANSSDPDTSLQYQNFINLYGTHFVYSMRMGGRYGYQSEITNMNSMELTTHGFDVKAAAGYSGLFSVSASAGTEEQKKQAEAFNSARSRVTEFFVGGGPPGNDGWTKYDWQKTVEEDPLPLKYKLVRIENMFTDYYFPDDNDIDAKRDILKEALLEYCRKLSIVPGLCDSAYNDFPTLIPIRILSPENVKQYKAYHIPLLEPNEKAAGIMVGSARPNTSFIIRANNESQLIDLVRPADGWVRSNHSKESDLMPACPEGFRSISDFHQSPYLPDFNYTTLPCFAEKCVSNCTVSYEKNGDFWVYQNGYPALGGYYLKALYSFYRCLARNRPDDDGWKGENRCLSYSCLDF